MHPHERLSQILVSLVRMGKLRRSGGAAPPDSVVQNTSPAKSMDIRGQHAHLPNVAGEPAVVDPLALGPRMRDGLRGDSARSQGFVGHELHARSCVRRSEHLFER